MRKGPKFEFNDSFKTDLKDEDSKDRKTNKMKKVSG